MPAKKMFRCPRCRHSEVETIPNRLRCPKCGASIPRPERGQARSDGPPFERRRVQQFFY